MTAALLHICIVSSFLSKPHCPYSNYYYYFPDSGETKDFDGKLNNVNEPDAGTNQFAQYITSPCWLEYIWLKSRIEMDRNKRASRREHLGRVQSKSDISSSKNYSSIGFLDHSTHTSSPVFDRILTLNWLVPSISYFTLWSSRILATRGFIWEAWITNFIK